MTKAVLHVFEDYQKPVSVSFKQSQSYPPVSKT